MSTQSPSIASRPELRATAPQRQAPRHMYRARDFGVGYGSSSGYAGGKRYTPLCGQPRFKFC